MSAKFYACEACKKVLYLMENSSEQAHFDNKNLKELKPDVSDGASEKHVPVVEVKDTHVLVFIGETEHPMVEEHYIEWIALETETGIQIKYLSPGEKPHAEFLLTEHEKPVAAYEFCNIHGLWKKEISRH